MRSFSLALALSALTACGGGSEGGNHAVTLLDAYVITTQVHLVPSSAGASMGMSECDMTVKSTVHREPADSTMTCDGCEAIYKGTPDSTMSDCQNAGASGEAYYGLLPRDDGDLDVWVEDGGALAPQGAAVADDTGAAWSLAYTQQMGSDQFNLGDAQIQLLIEE